MDEFEFRSTGGSLAGYLKIPDIAGESHENGIWLHSWINGIDQREARVPDIDGESLDGIWGTTGTLFEDPLLG